MKKSITLLLVLVMLVGIMAGCGAKDATDSTGSTAEAPAGTSAETEKSAAKTIETLKIAFVPSREPQEIIKATEPLKQLLKEDHRWHYLRGGRRGPGGRHDRCWPDPRRHLRSL